jgi:hypothetical protein
MKRTILAFTLVSSSISRKTAFSIVSSNSTCPDMMHHLSTSFRFCNKISPQSLNIAAATADKICLGFSVCIVYLLVNN